MKKLLLLLILSFFSAQSFAGSCPDGSDPVKSISADGTYFVYNCGGNDTSTKTNNSATSSEKITITEIKKSMDDDGILQLKEFHILNAPHAINPVSVSDFSIIGKTSIRFESNNGECGQEPNHSDCDTDRERTEVYHGDESWKTEKWYRFYLYLPKDYNSVAPAKMSLIQWSVPDPFAVLIQFQHMHAGLTFNRNGSTFPDSYIVLKPNEDLLGNWTEIIFNTNWHPDPEKGFMKVWIDGKLKIDFKGRANSKNGRKLTLRYGLYSSYMSYYKNTFKRKKMPQRIAFYDGVKAEKNCQKLLDINTCNNLISQNIKEYKLFIHDSNDKELHGRSICKITPANFEANERAALLGVEYNQGVNLCTYVKPTELFTTIEASDAFDGSYSFTLSRFKPSEGLMKLGSGQLEISDGKISVAKKSRSLKTSSTTYYDTFEGQIDKEGNISAVFNVNALNGEGIPQPVVFTGTIDALQIKGKFDDYFDMIIKIKPVKPVKKASKASSAFDDSLTLDNLTIPDNWQLVKDKKAFGRARLNLKNLIPKMLGLDENACLSMVKDWRNSMKLKTSTAGRKQKDESSAFGSNNSDIGTDIQDCLDKLIYTTQNYKGTPNYMKQILLHWAKTDAVFIPNGVQNDILDDYIYMAVQSWSSLGSYYGTFYDEFNYSDADRKIVDAYIKNKLLNINTRNLINVGKTCDPNNLKRTIEGQFSTDPRNGIDNDSCGSSVWKTIPAQLLVGLRLNDKALFKKGIENTKYQLSFFDDTGIFTTWAIKGSAAYHYTASVPVMLGGLTEIYASVGYDFMEHKLRNGLSVKELMDRQYELFDNPHLLDSWVKRYPHDYKGTPNSVYLQSSVEQIRNDAGLNLFAFVRNLPRYIDTYRADIGNSREFDKKLGKQSHNVKQKVASMSAGNFQPLDPYLVYISNLKETEISSSKKTKTAETPTVATSDSDPTISKVIEVIQGDKFIVEIAEPHELAGTNINLNLRDIDAPDAVRSCPKQLEFGKKVKDIVTQKLTNASSIKITNFRKTSKAIIAQVIVDGKDLGAELIENGYASDEYGHWKAYFCSALHAVMAGSQFQQTGDYEKAIFWYERALILDPDGSNNSRATYDLSQIYAMYGDDKKSLDYLKQSAELNYMKAQEDLGASYMNGTGVSKNLAQAKKWLKKAHENGSGSAEDICGCEF